MRRITLHMFTPVSVRRARACANSPVVTRQFAEVMMKRLLLLGTIGLLAACAESPTSPASVSVSAAKSGNSSNAKSCQKNGWTGLVTSSGQSFVSEEACVSYAAQGGQLYRTQTISFTSTNPSPVTVGAPSYTPTATATSGLPVAFTLDGASTGFCALSSGVVNFLSVGTCVINANQAGNSVYYPAPQQTQSISILYKPQTISFTSTNPSPVSVGDPSYTPTATATSGLTVAITLDGTSTGCALSSGVVSFLSLGTCVINANQAGNSVYYPAPQQTQSITIAVPTLVTEDVLVAPVGNWGRVTGFGLHPDADLHECFTILILGTSCINVGDRTDARGRLLYEGFRQCFPPFATEVYHYTLRADGTTIISNRVDQTACPT